MNVVIDTNILVSAIWSPGRTASEILQEVFSGTLTACYDSRILEEYDRVLHYKKFGFNEWEINDVLEPLIKNGIAVIAPPIRDVSFERDEEDRKFYEVAKFCRAVLITGNLKHFPEDPDILTPADFLRKFF